jgi:outer membrane protein assembly factor BamB
MGASSVDEKETVESDLEQLWTADIGFTSYRTESVTFEDLICIGSNGRHFMDYALDEDNGIYLLNRKTGKIIHRFSGEQFGDMDVNGILYHDGNIFFGNDNEEAMSVTKTGKVNWRIHVAGDVEHQPILIHNGKNPFVVFATETGQVHAVHPKTGKTAWNFFVPDYKGWKPGDSRTVFKVKMYFHSGQRFFDEPAVLDLNSDGVEDLLYNHDYGSLLALDGKSGKPIWAINSRINNKYAINLGTQKPMIMGKGKDARIVCPILGDYDEATTTVGKSGIAIFNTKGTLLSIQECSESLGNPKLSQSEGTFMTSKALLIPDKNNTAVRIIPLENATALDDEGNAYSRFPEAQIAKRQIHFNGEQCILAVLQYEYDNDLEQSPVLIIGTKTGKVHKKTYMPCTSEYTPEILDANEDGMLDVLIGGFNGKLYCFKLGISNDKLVKN